MTLSIGVLLFLIAGIVATIEAVRTHSLIAVAIALLAFAHVVA